MSATRGRPKAATDLVSLGTVSVARDVCEAIDSLVGLSGGVSKTAFVRAALLAGLQPYTLISPELAAALRPTPYERKS